MRIPMTLFALAFLSGTVQAHEPPAPCSKLSNAAQKKACQKAITGKAPVKRRPVRQVIEPTPRIAAPAAAGAYGPVLHPQRPASTMAGVPASSPAVPSSMPPPTVPPPPVQIGTCGTAGCTDASGTRYTGGIGNTVLDPQGRNCTRTGTTIQCF